MFILLLLLWIVFNEKITLEVVLLGMVMSGLVYWFSCKFAGLSPKKELLAVKRLGYIMQYSAVLIIEIIKANIATIKVIFSHRYEVEPVLVTFSVHFDTKVAKVLFANSITLTPGTITVDVIGDKYTVHALDVSYTDGINKGKIVDILHRMEAIHD